MSGMGNNGVYNPINLSLYTYTANNPINLIDPTGKIWGPFEHADHTQTPEQQRQTGSMILDYAPFVGAGKSIQEAATGENIVTGEELSGGDRAWGLLGVIPGGRLVGNGFKWAGDKIGEGFSWAKGLFKTSKIRSVDDVLANPNLLKGKSPEEVETLIGKTDGWKVENLRQGSKKGQGWVMREYNEKGNETGRMLRWHPGSPRKGNKPYWRVNDFETKSEPIFQ